MTNATMTEKQIQWATERGFRVLANTDREIACVAYLAKPGETVDRDGWIVGTGRLAARLTVVCRDGIWSTSLRTRGIGRPERFFSGEAYLVWAKALETLRGMTSDRDSGGWGWDLRAA
jgi:hypothetical protein